MTWSLKVSTAVILIEPQLLKGYYCEISDSVSSFRSILK